MLMVKYKKKKKKDIILYLTESNLLQYLYTDLPNANLQVTRHIYHYISLKKCKVKFNAQMWTNKFIHVNSYTDVSNMRRYLVYIVNRCRKIVMFHWLLIIWFDKLKLRPPGAVDRTAIIHLGSKIIF